MSSEEKDKIEKLIELQEQQLKVQKDHSNSLARLEVAIMGDNEIEVIGIAKRTKSLEEYREKDKKQKWAIAGGVAVGGFLFKFWEKIVNMFH